MRALVRPPAQVGPASRARRCALFALSLAWMSAASTAAPHQAGAQAAPRRAAPAPPSSAPPTVDDLIAAALGGGPDADVDAALDALRARADERATDALVSLARHRRVGARRRAYLALAALRSSAAQRAVSDGLSDTHASVRSVCAQALGDMGARDALPRLILALERGVVDATVSIGALAHEDELTPFHAQLGRVPLGAMLEGYARLVRRSDISWRAKQDILHRLFEVAGLEVRAFLVQWQRDLAPDTPAALRQDLERSIRRIPLRPRARTNAVPPDARAVTRGAQPPAPSAPPAPGAAP